MACRSMAAFARRDLAKQPLYWRQQPDGWYEYRLDGLYRLDKARPVVHVSAFEAMAYAAWANARLLTKRNGNGQPEFIKAAVILLNRAISSGLK
ncbi:MAG: hypothetical protein CM15mP68_7150 [Pseudomonadota bacterium]|nr:MAG: hypothetical protein CM15mP68_7150 [Pseudomonadota bacterium]